MRRFGLNAAITMAGLLLATMGVFATVGFGCFAFYLYLANFIAPPLAALAAAFTALMFALAATGIASLLRRRRRHSLEDDFAGLADLLAFGKTLGLESRDLFTTRFSKTALMVFGLGFLIGLSPRLRKLLSDFLFR